MTYSFIKDYSCFLVLNFSFSIISFQICFYIDNCFLYCRWECRNFQMIMIKVFHGRRLWNLVVLYFREVVPQLTSRINGETFAKEAQNQSEVLLNSLIMVKYQLYLNYALFFIFLLYKEMVTLRYLSKDRRLC